MTHLQNFCENSLTVLFIGIARWSAWGTRQDGMTQGFHVLKLRSFNCLLHDLRLVTSNIRFYSRFKPIVNPPPFLKRPDSSGNSANTVGVAAEIFSSKNMACREPVKDAIIWVDCEMSGLDISKDTIMEIACIITGPKLDVVACLPSMIIKTPDSILDSMGAWCLQHHGESGLTEGCRKSNITMEHADEQLLDFVSKYTEPGTCPMAGNSIYMDRMFISKYLPKFHSHFHYRNVDVSSIKEVVKRWFPEEYHAAPKKRFEHRTLADIEDSIEELKYYRSAVFKSPVDNNDNSDN